MSEEHKSPIAKKEEEILAFWQKNKIFEKTLEKPAPKGDFVFYDGPPFATGEPHFGHALPTTIKDIIPRYKTMQGHRVERKWGWDCHGLPIENLIEKELGFNSKREIEEYGIGKFNQKARASVLRYADVWKKIIPRLGRWVDMENDYRTMDSTYTESVWWSFKRLFDKKRIYQSFKVMQYCPRCGTTLSNFEVNQGYKDVTDISVYAKFELMDEPGTFLLAWTTTPWTLPGNVALAINPDIKYVKVKSNDKLYVLAKERVSTVFKDTPFEIVGEVQTNNLLGKAYRPLFPYYQDAGLRTVEGKLADKKRAWRIYAGNFVTTEEGTGIVHMAPAFGDEDFQLAKKEDLPFIQHVDGEGKFKKEITDFAGQLVKPKEDHQRTDVEIIKYLAAKNLLFAKEKIIHPYPHCWRCDTPLLNYAASSWFVRVTDFKHKLVKENDKIRWVPQSIGKNRFGDWLEGARDWAISRSRYWGAPIPIWKCEKCHKIEALGSMEDVRKKTVRNTYYLMRHGQADNNRLNVLSSNPDNSHHLTEEGRNVVTDYAKTLKDKKIDLIIHSPFLRTTETADIVKKIIDFRGETLTDTRLFEMNFGDLNGKPVENYHNYYSSPEEELNTPLPNGESINDLKKRVGKFLYETDQKYKNRKILIITHDAPAAAIFTASIGGDDKKLIEIWGAPGDFLNPGQFREMTFAQIPHNENYELDFHRPYIDEVKWPCDCGGEFRRVPEVFDVWYESGSMPYGKLHFPFDKNSVRKNLLARAKPTVFPADFIAEGLDQTRGWFYSLLVLNYELFGESPYKNVVVNGLILAEDGRKMSKSLQNYPDISPTINKYGADALRFFLMSSPAVRAEEVRFSEKGLDEVTKKVINRLLNVVSFYELYKDQTINDKKSGFSENVLDKWILTRLNQLSSDITKHLDNYELDKAARPIDNFVDDLSTWYLRRSRERFKSEDEKDKNFALTTLQFVLLGLSKLIAPFMPFLAEDVHGRVGGKMESVHLEEWPHFTLVSRGDPLLLNKMESVRKIVSLGLEARTKANVKVRQPLAELKIKESNLTTGFLQLIKDEINVKKVTIDKSIDSEVWLDTKITLELKEEGELRDLVRMIQDLRRSEKFNQNEKAELTINSFDKTRENFVNKYKIQLMKLTGLSAIVFNPSNNIGKNNKEIEEDFWFTIKRIK